MPFTPLSCHPELSRALRTGKTRISTRDDFSASVTLKGKLEACPYKESSAIVAASFQLAIPASKDSISLKTFHDHSGRQGLSTAPLMVQVRPFLRTGTHMSKCCA